MQYKDFSVSGYSLHMNRFHEPFYTDTTKTSSKATVVPSAKVSEMDDLAEVFRNAENKNPSTEFKKPVLIGKRPGNKTSHPSKIGNVKLEISHTNKNNEVPASEKSSTVKTSSEDIHLKYNPPPTSLNCSLPYQLEVLKDGVIVHVEDLKDHSKSYVVFGRLPTCDISLQHPSISRYHAILQYKSADDETSGNGWYLFDLGSTHGTYLNKQQIVPNVYHRVHTGHMFKLGGSSRLFILQGPQEDQEPVSELTVTQLKELKMQRLMSLESHENIEKPGVDSTIPTSPTNHASGIDWGMGEDAEDENPTSENPFAVLDEGQLNETFYFDDPKKTLRGWFEREGYELEYKVEEKSYAYFVCRVELPINSASGKAPVIAEAQVKGGKKKEAVVQCALEACRILDHHGVLRQSKHESRSHRIKPTFDEDYYSSDEDTFLDRTGVVEQKRLAKMKEKSSSNVETHESLLSRHQDISKEISDIRETLEKISSSSNKSIENDDFDDVDAYVKALQTTETARDKKSIKMLRLKLNQLLKEESKLTSLIKLTRPLHLETPSTSIEISACSSSEPKFKEPFEAAKIKNEVEKVDKPTNEEVLPQSTVLAKSVVPTTEKVKTSKMDGQRLTTTSSKLNDSPEKIKPDMDSSTDQSEEPSEREQVGLVVRKRKKKELKPPAKDMKVNQYRSTSSSFVEEGIFDDSKYAEWTPPADQSGDGKTSLNRKYGY
nr:EOG090X026V [Scapholeberis mucronata]